MGTPRAAVKGPRTSTGSMVITNGAQKWWTGRPPIDRLAPLDLDALDSIALEKAKDALGNIVGGIGGGRVPIQMTTGPGVSSLW
jgi:hypothetical protein